MIGAKKKNVRRGVLTGRGGGTFQTIVIGMHVRKQMRGAKGGK